MSNINNISHSVEVSSFSMANTKSVEVRKGLYDAIERDLKAIWNEAVGFDLHEGYYLHFNKNEDGSWKTDLHVSIRQDDAYWESHLRKSNKDIEDWCTISEVERLHDKGIVSTFPCHLCSIFNIEPEVGDRWSKKTKLSVGTEYGAHHYTTNEARAAKRNGSDEEFCPKHNSYSAFKQIKGSQEYGHNQIKTDKAYRLFKYYVVQFFARIAELKAGYEQAKALAEPHSEYLYKLKVLENKQNELNEALWAEFNPDAKPDAYKREYVSIGNERIWLNDIELQSRDNIDVTTQILDLISKLKFKKQK
jgi:hypothetical protein